MLTFHSPHPQHRLNMSTLHPYIDSVPTASPDSDTYAHELDTFRKVLSLKSEPDRPGLRVIRKVLNAQLDCSLDYSASHLHCRFLNPFFPICISRYLSPWISTPLSMVNLSDYISLSETTMARCMRDLLADARSWTILREDWEGRDPDVIAKRSRQPCITQERD